MLKGQLLLITCATTIAMLYGAVQASEAYAQSHPLDGLQLKMMYCVDMQRYEGQPLQDIGCKVGHGVGRVGVKKDIIKQLVDRINIYKNSYEHTQLVSKEGLRIVFHDDTVGSKGKATVWQDGDGKVSFDIERDK